MTLQDDYGADVTLALFAVWLGVEEGGRDAPTLERAVEASERWASTAVRPIRAVRRALKPGVDGIGSPLVEAFREQVKALELDAERVQHAALARLAAQSARTEAPLGPAAAGALFDTVAAAAGWTARSDMAVATSLIALAAAQARPPTAPT